jgi:hypothetical protein
MRADAEGMAARGGTGAPGELIDRALRAHRAARR